MVVGNDLKVSWADGSPNRQNRKIKKIVRHEAYVDIALIILETPFFLSTTFKPVNVTNVAPIDNEPCRVGK